MAYFEGTFRSRVLDMETNVNLILPNDNFDSNGVNKPYTKVLYMLHGLRQNASSWPRMSSIERYARYYGYAVIVPEVQRSWYCDMPGGLDYYTFVSEELPELVNSVVKLPQERENTFIGGLSMGGYGALKCVLRRPDRFGGAMCFSSAFYSLDNAERLQRICRNPGELRGVIGDDLVLRDEDSIDYLIRNFPADAPKPKLYLACGTEDSLFDSNVRTRDTLREHGFELTWEQWAGAHDWKFWDPAADRAMRLFAGIDAE